MAGCALEWVKERKGKNKTQTNILINYPATAANSLWSLEGLWTWAKPYKPIIGEEAGARQCQAQLEGHVGGAPCLGALIPGFSTW